MMVCNLMKQPGRLRMNILDNLYLKYAVLGGVRCFSGLMVVIIDVYERENSILLVY